MTLPQNQPPMHKYRYTTYPFKPTTRIEAARMLDPPGHRLGWKKRKCEFHSKEVQWAARCICKWISPWSAKAYTLRLYESHCGEAIRRQPSIFTLNEEET